MNGYFTKEMEAEYAELISSTKKGDKVTAKDAQSILSELTKDHDIFKESTDVAEIIAEEKQRRSLTFPAVRYG